jgi:hypothetical protein
MAQLLAHETRASAPREPVICLFARQWQWLRRRLPSQLRTGQQAPLHSLHVRCPLQYAAAAAPASACQPKRGEIMLGEIMLDIFAWVQPPRPRRSCCSCTPRPRPSPPPTCERSRTCWHASSACWPTSAAFLLAH